MPFEDEILSPDCGYDDVIFEPKVLSRGEMQVLT